MRTYLSICGIGSRLGEANFRFARQPPIIVTWAELDFYDLPLIRPSDFVNSGRQRSSSQELLELLGDGRRYDYHRMLSRFLPIIPNRHVIPLKGS